MRREGARIIFEVLGHDWREYIAIIEGEKGMFRAFQTS